LVRRWGVESLANICADEAGDDPAFMAKARAIIESAGARQASPSSAEPERR
jgi:hypothetical protein